jgi:hypothetical protein
MNAMWGRSSCRGPELTPTTVAVPPEVVMLNACSIVDETPTESNA